jgi:arsenite methyltransferase
MKPELTAGQRRAIREAIRGKYAQVAAAGSGCCFQYPTGKEGMLRQGYPPEVLQPLPEEVLASFCGVGNPFSLGPVHPGEAVLDVGCGAGVDSLVAAQLVGPAGRVIGVDVTAEMIAKARSTLERLDLPQVSFQIGDAESLPFPDHHFQVIISNGVLNLTLNQEQALREAYRVLKPGGRFMVADQVLVAALPPDLANNVANWYQ